MAAKRLDPPAAPDGTKPFTWRLDKDELDLLCYPAERMTDLSGVAEKFNDPRVMAAAFGVVLIALVGERAYATVQLQKARLAWLRQMQTMGAAQQAAMMQAQQAAAAEQTPTAEAVQAALRQAGFAQAGEAPVQPNPEGNPAEELISMGIGL